MARARKLLTAPQTLAGQVALVAVAFLALEAIYLLAAGKLAYQAGALVQFIPWAELIMDQWRDGTFPIWDSVLGTGDLLLASRPLDWRYLLFLPFSALDGYIVASVVTRVIAAVITFAYLRSRVGASGIPAFIGALLFLSTTSLVEEGTGLAFGIVAFPGLVWLSERLLESTTTPRLVALGAGWGLFLLINSLAHVPYLAVGAFAWCLLWGRYRKPGLDRGHALRFAVSFAGACAIGAGIAAVMVLPTLELASNSNRGGEYPTEPYAASSLLSAIGINRASGQFPLGSFYLYVGVVSFAPIAVAIRRRGDPYVRAAVTLGLATAAIALTGFVAKSWLVDVIPSLATLSFSRPTFLIGFTVAVLVARGLQEPEGRLGLRARRMLAALFLVQAAILIALAALGLVELASGLGIDVPLIEGWLAPLYLGVLATLLVAIRALGLGGALAAPRQGARLRIGGVRLGRVALVGALLATELALAWGLSRPMISLGYERTPEVRFLQARTGPQLRAMEILHRPEWKPVLPGLRDLSLNENAPAYWGIPVANIYSSLVDEDYSETFADFGDLGFRREIFEEAPNAFMTTSRYDSPLLRALGVGYLYSPSELPSPRLSRLAFRGEGYYIYELIDPLPRAFFAGRARWLPHDRLHRELARVGAGGPGAVALGPEVLLEGSARTEGKPAYAPARVVSDSGASVEVSLTAPRAGFLVLSDLDAPGWSAEVDGRSTPIHQANGFARAVRVPAAEHTVEFDYAPPSLTAGAVISGATALLCLFALGAAASARRLRRARSRA